MPDRERVTLVAPEDISFAKALSSEDDLGAVVRVAIWVESLVMRLVEQPLPAPKALKDLNLDYHGKVQLAVALGMPEEMAAVLKALGSLRNRFAHQLDMVLKESDVSNVYKALPPARRSYLHEFLKQMHAEGLVPTERYASLSPRVQLSLIAMSIRSFLLGGLREQKAVLDARPSGHTAPFRRS